MKQFYDWIPKKLKEAYILWLVLNIVLLLSDLEYGKGAFLLLIIFPLLIALSLYLFKKDNLRVAVGWKVAYFIWVLLHLVLLVLARTPWGGGYRSEVFFPFKHYYGSIKDGWYKQYDYTEFIVYLIVPIIIAKVVSFIKDKSGKIAVQDKQFENKANTYEKSIKSSISQSIKLPNSETKKEYTEQNKEFKNRLNIRWKYIFIAILIIVLISILLTTNKHLKYVEYNSTGNEFRVTFSGKPKIKSSSAGGYMEFETAELILPDDNSFQRCESFLLSGKLIEQINGEFVFNQMNEYARFQGLSVPELHYEVTELGKIGTLRGYKELEDENGKLWEITYFGKAVYGERSGVILYVGSPSENYPTPEIMKFLNSIKKVSLK